jgi:hypothetical protein
MKDFQFEHEHFHLFESAEALLHFCSINLRQIVRLNGFAHTSYPPAAVSGPRPSADSATEPRNPETGAAPYVVENRRR